MIGGMKKGLFGKSRMMPDMMEGYGGGRFTPGIGDGQNAPSMPQNETMQHTPEMQRMLAGVPLPKQGMDWKNVALSALGGAADGAAQHFGMAPMVAIQRNQQAQMQAQAQRDQAMRMAGLEDYRAKKGIDAQFASPEKDAFDRALVGAGIDPNSEQGRALYAQRASTLAQGQPAQPNMVSFPDGRAFFGTMQEIQQMLGGGQAAPQVLGSSLPQGWTIEGGAASNGGGNFPR
jgi:hypothetical protein